MDLNEKKIFIAGAKGMVGRSIERALKNRKHTNLLCPPSSELDLTRQAEVEQYFESNRPEVVIVAAAKVGGILANNTYRAEFLYTNMMIEANLINAAFKYGAEKLVFLGSSCIYPKMCPQPMREEYLLTGPLEPTNEPYAIGKIAGVKLCESYYRQYGCNFISVMPTNLYGFYDNFDLESSHVIPALMRKFHEAKITNAETVPLWGTGTPRREFMYVDDLADAVIFATEKLDAADIYVDGISHINIGTGTDVSIAELAILMESIVESGARIEFDPAMPDGTPRKLLDTSRLAKLGWKFSTDLEAGLRETYKWFIENAAKPASNHA